MKVVAKTNPLFACCNSNTAAISPVEDGARRLCEVCIWLINCTGCVDASHVCACVAAGRTDKEWCGVVMVCLSCNLWPNRAG